MTDDYFPSSSFLQPQHDDLSNVNCSGILKQFNVLEDVREDLCAPYNVTLNLCRRIFSDDKELQLCGAEAKNNQSNSSSDAESCADIEEYFNEASETLEEFYKQSKVNCQRQASCFDCIKESLGGSGDYETLALHAIAVNFTVIDFEVWNYFRISSRVHELVNEANRMLRIAVDDCWIKQECVDVDERWKAS